MSDNLPIFLEYDSEKEEQKLVKLFEEKTGRQLYPAQDERLLISIIEYKAALLVNLFNEAARLNLTQYSRGEILDCLGEMFGTYRLTGEYGTDILRITLNTTFSNDLTINKGLEVLSKDEKFLFETTEDLVIPAGETFGEVKIQAKETGSEQNNYGIGDINILIRPVSYIQSVENINGISEGADIESDNAYIKRILLAPEKFTCAGSKQSYIYHTLSANTKILDASVESVSHPASVTIDGTTYNEINGQITTPDFTINLNKKFGQFEFNFNNHDYKFTMIPDCTVKIYPLTEESQTSESVIEDVSNLLNGEDINPMTDNIIVCSPEKVEEQIVLDIKLKEDADYDKSLQEITEKTNAYKNKIRLSLNSEIVPSQIISQIGSIDGVYSVTTDISNTISCNINQYFDIDFTININQ